MKMETYATKAARAMCASVLAAGLMIPSGVALANTSVADSQVTIEGLQSGDTVSAYKIAGVDINADNTLNYTFATGLPTAYDSVEELSKIATDGYSFKQGTDMQKAAAAIANGIVGNGAAKTAEATGSSATLTLPSGYYLVRVTSTSGNTKVYQNMVVDVTPQAEGTAYKAHDNVSAAVKSTEVTVTKKVGKDYTGKTDAYQVGDEVPFQITTAIPSYPAGSPNATFVIGDTPTAGLSIDTDSIKVEGATADTDYTIDAKTTGYTITFTKDFILKNPGVHIEVTYNATLTKDAFSKADGTVTGNTATVKFNPNPYTTTTVTPEDKATVQTYGYVFDKTGKDDVALEGAVFTLYNADGTAPVKDENGNLITSTSKKVGDKAYVYFSGLKSGSYKAKETTVPAGYTAVSDIEFSVSSTDATGDNPATTDVKENNFKVNSTSVKDPEASALPVTGGAGTMAVTVAGVAFIGGAAYLIVRSRRKGEEQQ